MICCTKLVIIEAIPLPIAVNNGTIEEIFPLNCEKALINTANDRLIIATPALTINTAAPNASIPTAPAVKAGPAIAKTAVIAVIAIVMAVIACSPAVPVEAN